MAVTKYGDLSNFAEKLAEVVGGYSREVYQAVIDGVPEAAETFRDQCVKTCVEDNVIDLDAAMSSPFGYYKDNFVVKERTQSKFHKYVGNRKTVPDKKHGNIPLINILEYGTHKNSHPHMDKAIASCEDEILDIFVKKLNGG